MRKKERFLCGLDIGTFKLCAALGRLDYDGKMDILAADIAPAEGMDSGRITDSGRLSSCIRDTCFHLGRMSGKKIQRVYVNIDGGDVKVKTSRTKVSFNRHKRITAGQIHKLLSDCVAVNASPNRKIIHTAFSSFLLDSRAESVYPGGLPAGELETDVVLVSALIPAVDSLSRCVTDAGLVMEGLIPSVYAQVLSLFKDRPEETDEKYSVFVDVGAALVKAAFLKGNAVRDMIIFPGGAAKITQDIAARLKVSRENAERLKVEYGNALPEERALGNKVIIGDKIVSSGELNAVVSAGADCLLRKLKGRLAEAQNKYEEIGSFVFTGGGAALEGFLERAEQILERKVRLGVVSVVQEGRIQTQSALYSTGVGLARCGLLSGNKGTFPLSIQGRLANRPFYLQRLIKKAEGLYREYF